MRITVMKGQKLRYADGPPGLLYMMRLVPST